MVWTSHPFENLPAAKGAYVLLIRLDTPVSLRIKALCPTTLPPGLYAYCGSAHGPGGIAARVGRHLRRDKAVRWHVDRLTAAGRIVAVYARSGARECDLFARICGLTGTSVPVPGFGSSDCRRCPAHLAAVPRATSIPGASRPIVTDPREPPGTPARAGPCRTRPREA